LKTLKQSNRLLPEDFRQAAEPKIGDLPTRTCPLGNFSAASLHLLIDGRHTPGPNYLLLFAKPRRLLSSCSRRLSFFSVLPSLFPSHDGAVPSVINYKDLINLSWSPPLAPVLVLEQQTCPSLPTPNPRSRGFFFPGIAQERLPVALRGFFRFVFFALGGFLAGPPFPCLMLSPATVNGFFDHCLPSGSSGGLPWALSFLSSALVKHGARSPFPVDASADPLMARGRPFF